MKKMQSAQLFLVAGKQPSQISLVLSDSSPPPPTDYQPIPNLPHLLDHFKPPQAATAVAAGVCWIIVGFL